MTWDAAYSLLADTGRHSDADAMCAAITRLGKPFNEVQVNRAGPLVSTYLQHENFLVRYQAIWFLGCWGKLREYLPQIIESARSDKELDNRAYAARCAGQILKFHRDANAIDALLCLATNEKEEPDVRLAAYSSLLYAFYGVDGKSRAREFEPMGDKLVVDFDLSWLATLPQWVKGLAS